MSVAVHAGPAHRSLHGGTAAVLYQGRSLGISTRTSTEVDFKDQVLGSLDHARILYTLQIQYR